MSEMTIEVQPRQETGTNENRRLRARGKIPAVVYGGAGKDAVPIHVDRKQLVELLRGGGGDNAVFLLKLASTGQERHAMIRDMQLDPITREILHLDFQRVVMTEKVRVEVAIELRGTAYGVKTESGVLDFSRREIHVECLPGDIPKAIELDVSELHLGQHLTVGDLHLPSGVTLLEPRDRVLVSVMHAKTEAAPAVEEAAAPVEAGPEPEVIKKGKTEEA
ncbi:MAG: 50S ribosomal protein L25 [Acidobacteria bacterium]|nr:50S ribosomal protein L25 [Acidobacteriota bacterium]